MTPAALSLFAFLVLLPTTVRSAEEKPITGFTLILEEGLASFRLADHSLFFNEGEGHEESVTLTDEQLARTLLLFTSSPMIAAKFAKKPAGKVAIEIHVVRAGAAAEDRYLTEADGRGIEKDMEAKAKANADDPKALALLDQQSELYFYLYSLATAGPRLRYDAPVKP